MLKKALLVAPFFLFALTSAHGQETFTISGEVSFQYDGNIYMCLLNHDGYRDFVVPGRVLSSQECKVIQIKEELKKSGTAPFSFDHVPKGTYTIIAYQDVNNNGKVDFENYEINEPFGSFRSSPYGMTTWDGVKFSLENNMNAIKIDL